MDTLYQRDKRQLKQEIIGKTSAANILEFESDPSVFNQDFVKPNTFNPCIRCIFYC